MDGTMPVVDTKIWPEDGEFGDIIKGLHKTGDIICMAAEVTDPEAKRSLLSAAKKIIGNCYDALEVRADIVEDED